jgi:hypothetical protein
LLGRDEGQVQLKHLLAQRGKLARLLLDQGHLLI